MNIKRIQTIIDKEWAEVFKNRIVLFTIVLLPLLFTAMPLGILYGTRGEAAAGDVTDLPPQFLETCGPIQPAECFQVYLLNQFMLMFMMMPLIIPIAIAAYSIVGEKTTRSLEPLLATPITTEELLSGKALAAVVPAVLATWACFVVFMVAAPLVGAQPGVMQALVYNPVWLLAVFVAGPLMAVISVNLAVIVSSRVSDPRTAEQISAVVIVPLMAIVFGQISGVIVLNLQFMLSAIGVLTAVAVALVLVGASLFQRETILTKWK